MTVNLFINPYTDPRAERQKELTYSQRINAASEHINMIYELPGRATYKDFFDKINSVSGPRDINIIANLDIFFDETLKLAEALRPHEVFALSRWDVTSENPFNIKRYEEPGSQDVWMFRGPITRQIKYCDFPIGKMGCLAGDTIVGVSNLNGIGLRRISLKNLFNEYDNTKPWFSQSLDYVSGDLITNRILNVIESGVKDTIRLNLEGCKPLILTPDHRVATVSGYVEAKDLEIGEDVIGYSNRVETYKVESKEPAGECMTYDLEMAGPHHNFRANDIFVHNCDNRIAHELQQAGYLVLNPSKSIRCIHYHVSEQRNYNRAVRNADTVVPPPYAFVKSIFLPIYA